MKRPRPRPSKLRKAQASSGFAYSALDSGAALKDATPPAKPAGLESGAVCVSAPSSMFGVGQAYVPPIRQLGSELVTAAIDSARHGEHDRLVALTNAYVALVGTDGRARA